MEIRRKLWGRAQSHPLSEKQKQLLEAGLKSFTYDPEADFVPDVLEIGFGDGEHFIQNFIAEPNKNFLGCEPFLNGNVNVLQAVFDAGLQNVRLFQDDVHLIIDKLKDQSLERVYVLFPDPWPKKRHKKRRILNHIFMEKLHTKLKKGGKLIMASDDADYQQFIQEEAAVLDTKLKLLEITAPPKTKYARKAEKAGRTSYMYIYEVL